MFFVALKKLVQIPHPWVIEHGGVILALSWRFYSYDKLSQCWKVLCGQLEGKDFKSWTLQAALSTCQSRCVCGCNVVYCLRGSQLISWLDFRPPLQASFLVLWTWSKFMTMEIIGPSEELINTVFLSGNVVNYLANIYSHRFLCFYPWSEKLLIMLGIDKCRNMILVKVLIVSTCVCSALHGT